MASHIRAIPYVACALLTLCFTAARATTITVAPADFPSREDLYYETSAKGVRVVGNCHLHVDPIIDVFTADRSGCSQVGLNNPAFIGPSKYQAVTGPFIPPAVMYFDFYGQSFDLTRVDYLFGTGAVAPLTVLSSNGDVFTFPVITQELRGKTVAFDFNWTDITWFLFDGWTGGAPTFGHGPTSVTIEVPEPSTIGLMFVALIASVLVLRRRKTIQVRR